MSDTNINNLNTGQERPSVKDLPQAKKTIKQVPKKTIVEFNDEDVPIKDKEPKEEQVKQKKKNWLLRIIICVFVLFFLTLLFFGVWNRWFRYNDKELIISKWQISSSSQIVNIDKKIIDLGPNAKMEYTLDTASKVINYTIGDKSGQSHYRFSWDTNQLAIIENTNCDFFSTLFSDIKWFWDWSTCSMSKIDLSPAYTKNNRDNIDLENTGINDIMDSGQTQSILLDKITTKTDQDN